VKIEASAIARLRNFEKEMHAGSRRRCGGMLHSMEPAAPSPGEPPPAKANCCGGRSLPFVLLAAAAVVGAVLAANQQRTSDSNSPSQPSSAAPSSGSWTPAPQPQGETVSLAIDFGNGARREFAALAYSDGMTVGDLMRQARDFRPAIRFDQKGAGKMSFLTSLENVANEGAAGRNWLYSVDGQTGSVSFEVQPLQAGAAVLWEFRRGE
jgi:hypothetical protein